MSKELCAELIKLVRISIEILSYLSLLICSKIFSGFDKDMETCPLECNSVTYDLKATTRILEDDYQEISKDFAKVNIFYERKK